MNKNNFIQQCAADIRIGRTFHSIRRRRNKAVAEMGTAYARVLYRQAEAMVRNEWQALAA